MVNAHHYAGVCPRLAGPLLGLVLLQAYGMGAQCGERAESEVPDGVQILGRTALYYTNDVTLFSATRRMSLNADPTQPAIDQFLVGQGGDGVYEPTLEITKSWTHALGRTHAQVMGDGFVFMEKTAFTHGTLRVKLSQEFDAANTLMLSYYLSPDLYLGKNIVHLPLFTNGGVGESLSVNQPLAPERLTSQIGALKFGHRFTEDLELLGLARFGIRRYDREFAERNLSFWTFGPHLKTRIRPDLTWVLGYHFERGIAAGYQSLQTNDDVSYNNNFISTEFEWNATSHDTVLLGLHFELNDWLSHNPMDARFKSSESTYQVDLNLQHAIDMDLMVYCGTQYGYRILFPEGAMTSIFNLSMGVQSTF